MKFTQCPVCRQKAITSIRQIFRERFIRCSNCGLKLIHSTPIIVTNILAHAFLYYVAIQAILVDGVVVVWTVTLLFMLSMIAGCLLFPHLVVFEEKDTRAETSEIEKWHHSPIPYLVLLCAIVGIWHVYG